MATRSKPNWKVLDRLLTVLEKEGWSHAQIAEDWGISLNTLEGHLNREGESMPTPLREIDWQRFDELKAQGLPMLRISKEMEIPEATLRQRAQRRDRAHQRTPEEHQETPKVHPSIPYEAEVLTEHLRTPKDSDHTEDHPGTLEAHQEVMEDISQTVPDVPHMSTEEVHQGIPEHLSTPEVHPELSQGHSSAVHSGVPARQDHLISTPMVHPPKRTGSCGV
jgi:lambda repressor-like predicted transcriptional regulator